MNRLSEARSPYLRSAAHQPIHWHPWGPEAFAEARAANRPVLLDIGAAWCHWCHVMDRESYDDPAVADVINAHFVAVKVDRDERPDVDARYQRAVQALTGQGGWPLTAFLTTDGEVFHGGTYFPPADLHGRPGFRTVLRSVHEAWHGRAPQVAAQATALTAVLREAEKPGAAAGEAPAAVLGDVVPLLRRHFDDRHGGWGSAPKFPHPGAIRLLLARWSATGDASARHMVERTVEGMARGGIADQLGGGFHRYSVDAEWVVPHFEKMSYDNSELLRAFTEAHALLGAPHAAGAARGIVRWVHEVLAHDEAGYGASQDADVGLDDDGDYFTWTRDEVRAVLAGPELQVAEHVWDIGTAGEMHHDPARNVLFEAMAPAQAAALLGLPVANAAGLLEAARRSLRQARAQRAAPAVDRTRYASWNAMMAGALLRASLVFDEPWAEAHALATLRWIREVAPAGAVPHDLDAGGAGHLDDQVQVASAALDAWEATGDDGWLRWATTIAEGTWERHEVPADGVLTDVPQGAPAEGLLAVPLVPADDAPTPSGNGVAAVLALRLAAALDDPAWRSRGERIVARFPATGASLHRATLLLAADWLAEGTTEIVVTGPDSEATAALHHAALAACRPRAIVRRLRPGAPASVVGEPLRASLAAMPADQPRALVCVGSRCHAPVSTPAQLLALLAAPPAP